MALKTLHPLLEVKYLHQMVQCAERLVYRFQRLTLGGDRVALDFHRPFELPDIPTEPADN
jgi:hypothetical protein